MIRIKNKKDSKIRTRYLFLNYCTKRIREDRRAEGAKNMERAGCKHLNKHPVRCKLGAAIRNRNRLRNYSKFPIVWESWNYSYCSEIRKKENQNARSL